jgi:hypothetical protein
MTGDREGNLNIEHPTSNIELRIQTGASLRLSGFTLNRNGSFGFTSMFDVQCSMFDVRLDPRSEEAR